MPFLRLAPEISPTGTKALLGHPVPPPSGVASEEAPNVDGPHRNFCIVPDGLRFYYLCYTLLMLLPWAIKFLLDVIQAPATSPESANPLTWVQALPDAVTALWDRATQYQETATALWHWAIKLPSSLWQWGAALPRTKTVMVIALVGGVFLANGAYPFYLFRFCRIRVFSEALAAWPDGLSPWLHGSVKYGNEGLIKNIWKIYVPWFVSSNDPTRWSPSQSPQGALIRAAMLEVFGRRGGNGIDEDYCTELLEHRLIFYWCSPLVGAFIALTLWVVIALMSPPLMHAYAGCLAVSCITWYISSYFFLQQVFKQIWTYMHLSHPHVRYLPPLVANFLQPPHHSLYSASFLDKMHKITQVVAILYIVVIAGATTVLEPSDAGNATGTLTISRATFAANVTAASQPESENTITTIHAE